MGKHRITIILSMLSIILGGNIFFADADTWTQRADVGETGRESASGFSIENKGYIGVGISQSITYTKSFWEYNPSTNTWTQKANVGGIERCTPLGFSIGGKGFIGGGNNSQGQWMKDFWQYDPANDSWTQKADVPGPDRYNGVSFSIGSKGYMGTGYRGSSEYRDFWEYNPVMNIWTQKANFGGTARDSAVGFSIGTKGYIGTGYPDYKDFWEYDPATDTWTRKADFGGVGRDSAVGFSIGTKGYVGTGYKSLKDFWEYDPATDTWTQKADFGGTGRYYAVGFSIGSKGYIGTGRDGSGLGSVKDFWEYDPFATIDTMPDQFIFTDQANVALNTVLTSNIITVSGINATAPISITGGTYSINGGPYTSTSGTVSNGNTVTVKQTSSVSYSTMTNATLNIGGLSDTFSVTTQASPTIFYLTIIKSGMGAGSIIPNSGNITWSSATNGTASYIQGASVILTAIPDSISTFTGWSGGGCSGTGQCDVTVDAPKSVTATFSLNTYAITSPPITNGTISCTPIAVNHGSSAICMVAPGTGYHLVALTDNGADVTSEMFDNTYTINNVVSNHTISPTFAINTYQITTTAGVNGSMTPSSTVNHGSSATIVITPNANYHVEDVLVDGVSIGAATSYNFEDITASHTINATFAINTHTLAITKTGTGSGTVTDTPGLLNCGNTCSTSYTYGTNVTLTAIPSVGSEFTGWSSAVCAGIGTCSLKIINDIQLIAMFANPWGDVNNDGRIDIADAILSLQITSNMDTTGKTITMTADANNDDRIGVAEVIYILQKMAGMR